MSTTASASAARRALTLIEMMIAIAITATVLTVATTSLESGMKMSEAVGIRGDAVNNANDVVNAISLELRFAGPTGVTKTVIGNVVTYSYQVVTALTAAGPTYVGGSRVLLYDKVKRTLSKQVNGGPAQLLASNIAIATENNNLDGFRIDYSPGNNNLDVNLKVKAQSALDQTLTVYWEARQATIFLRSSLATATGITTATGGQTNNTGGTGVLPVNSAQVPYTYQYPPQTPPVNGQVPTFPGCAPNWTYQLQSPNVAAGQPTSVQIQGISTSTITSYGIGDGVNSYSQYLPYGLSLNPSTGVISGTIPSNYGYGSPWPYWIYVNATNQYGTGYGYMYMYITNPTAAKLIVPDQTAPAGREGIAYSYSMQYTDPTNYGYVNWTDATGLPPGLWFDYNGNITGTPYQSYGSPPQNGAQGTWLVKVTGRNSAGTTTGTVTINILPANLTPPTIANQSGTAAETLGFTYQLTATNATTYAISSLPNGLSLNASTGMITGTPVSGSAGSYPLTMTATNASGSTSATFNLTVQQAPPAPPTVANQSATGQATIPFNYQVVASYSGSNGVVTGYNWSGTLPNGLSFATATGKISGTPLTGSDGTYHLLVSAANAGGTSAAATLTIVIQQSPAQLTPSISSSATAAGTTGTAFSYTITATQSPTSFAASPLPTGLSINTTSGVISGTPTAQGTYTISLSASGGGYTGNATLTLTVQDPPNPACSFAWSGTSSKGSPASYTLVSGVACTINPPIGTAWWVDSSTVTMTVLDSHGATVTGITKSVSTSSLSNPSCTVTLSGQAKATFYVTITATAKQNATTNTVTNSTTSTGF